MAGKHAQPTEHREMFRARLSGLTQDNICRRFQRDSHTVNKIAQEDHWEYALKCFSDEWAREVGAEIRAELMEMKDAFLAEIREELAAGNGTGLAADKRWDKWIAIMDRIIKLSEPAGGPATQVNILAPNAQIQAVPLDELIEKRRRLIEDKDEGEEVKSDE